MVASQLLVQEPVGDGLGGVGSVSAGLLEKPVRLGDGGGVIERCFEASEAPGFGFEFDLEAIDRATT